jgi:hypothetical protein
MTFQVGVIQRASRLGFLCIEADTHNEARRRAIEMIKKHGFDALPGEIGRDIEPGFLHAEPVEAWFVAEGDSVA